MSYRNELTDFLTSFIDFENNTAFLDAGCGKGYDLIKIGEMAKPDSTFVGIDKNEKSINVARFNTRDDIRFKFSVNDLEGKLDFEDDTFDVVININVLECIYDKTGLIKELVRVLKPDGKLIVAHYDWDTQIFNVNDKMLFRKIIHTYNDWKQPWMNECDAWMGRRLNGIFNTYKGLYGNIYTKSAYRNGV